MLLAVVCFDEAFHLVSLCPFLLLWFHFYFTMTRKVLSILVSSPLHVNFVDFEALHNQTVSLTSLFYESWEQETFITQSADRGNTLILGPAVFFFQRAICVWPWTDPVPMQSSKSHLQAVINTVSFKLSPNRLSGTKMDHTQTGLAAKDRLLFWWMRNRSVSLPLELGSGILRFDVRGRVLQTPVVL